MYINVDMFTTFVASAFIGALPPTALGSISSFLASPSRGGMELGITVFTPHMVVNAVYPGVLEGAACEPLVQLPVCQLCIRVVQFIGPFIISFCELFLQVLN